MLYACLWVRYGSQEKSASSADVRPVEDEYNEDESGDLLQIAGLSDGDGSDEKDSESEGDSDADDASDK